MSHLALVSPTFRTTAPPARWAHDIRNTLSTVGLHLDTLERLAGSAGHKAVEAAHALMLRATAMNKADGAPLSDTSAMTTPKDFSLSMK